MKLVTHTVEFLLQNNITLGIMCYALVIFPIIGIMYIHQQK